MLGRPLLVLLSLSALIAAAAPATASAATCGQRDPATKRVARGTLVLNDRSSTTKDYKRSEGDHTLSLFFNVDGCELSATSAKPQVAIRDSKDGADFPAGAVAANPPILDPTEVSMDLTVHLDRLDPGAYGGLLEIRAPSYLATSRTPIGASRSAGIGWPLALGILGAVFGIAWTYGLTRAEAVVNLNMTEVVLLVGAGAVAGFGAGWGTWHNQDVWTLDDNGWATAVAGFTAATTGGLLTLSKAAFRTRGAAATTTAPADARAPASVPTTPAH